jgi:subtilisin family serine protease
LLDRYLINCLDTPVRSLELAILDTGIDDQHCYFDEEPRIAAMKSWTSGLASTDESGHGTHITGIILDLTRNVDVYIARVTNGRILEDMDAISEVRTYCL